jgi:hypothetical protein
VKIYGDTKNRDEAISERIATGFLQITQIRPRYFHSLFPAHPEPLVAPTTSANAPYNSSRTFGKSLTRTGVWSALCAWATPKMRWLPVS